MTRTATCLSLKPNGRTLDAPFFISLFEREIELKVRRQLATLIRTNPSWAERKGPRSVRKTSRRTAGDGEGVGGGVVWCLRVVITCVWPGSPLPPDPGGFARAPWPYRLATAPSLCQRRNAGAGPARHAEPPVCCVRVRVCCVFICTRTWPHHSRHCHLSAS